MKHLFVLLFFTGLLASCKKSNSIPAVQVEKHGKISEYVYIANNGAVQTSKMSYDNSGRLLTFLDSDHKYSFSYVTPSSLIVTRTKLSDGIVDQQIDCILNVAGAITKMDYKQNGSVIYTYLFTYDLSGNLKMVKGVSNGNTNEVEFIYENDVAISSKSISNGVLIRTTQYSYDYTKPNKTGLTHWNVWPSDILHGKPLKYHIAEFKDFDMNGMLKQHIKNSIEFDPYGYAIKETFLSITNNSKKLYQYKY